MDVKYQVFVSSTFEDLKEERRKVIEAIMNLGHIPVGMELFQAGDESQWEYIQRRITACDYYIAIVAERYGSEQDGKSYTQMEYEFARDNGIPSAALLLAKEARTNWPRDRVEFSKQDKVEAFRGVCQQKMCKYWENADDLAAKTILSLTELTREKPRTGWVRADRVPSDEILKELSRLSEEKRSLQTQLDAIKTSSDLVVPVDVIYRIQELMLVRVNFFFDGYGNETQIATLLDAFLSAHKILAIGNTAYGVLTHWQSDITIVPQGVTLNDNKQVEKLLAEFAARNLIDFSLLQTNNVRIKTFFLTPYGKDFAMHADHYLTRLILNQSTDEPLDDNANPR